MKKFINFDEEFGEPKELLCKNFNKTQMSIHPYFSGIYLCYQESFKSLKTDLSLLSSYPELVVWKDPHTSGYTVANDCLWHLYASKNLQKDIKLRIYSFPTNDEKIRLLKNVASSDFLSFLSSFHHNLNQMHPHKLLNLINMHISSEAILALNKKSSLKPHRIMSLDLLAHLLSYSRSQLIYRHKMILRERQNVLNQLEQNSKIVQQLLNDPDFVLSPIQLWKQ